ncbi:MAG: DNA polymerase III subunit gamma/tau, partial [Clostridia bacterium]|nr:DNA polymerase III subunit gamma/tau [Clostridia bacterium]
IDAASNNSVDDIRDLRGEVNFTPARAKYRVYIIDEVHMLSSGAFNALLKTLEEPPEHVLFLLATTEVQKIPATILSRCQRFDFRRIPPEDIAARLQYVAGQEQIDLTDDAATLIARVADGAMRDALSILDQCAGAGGQITAETVGATVGMLGRSYLFEISDAIAAGSDADVLDIVDRLHNSSCDMERLMSDLVGHYRNFLLAKTVRDPEKFIVCTAEELTRYREAAKQLPYGTLLHVIDTLCAESSQLKYVANQRARTEATLIRLCHPALSTDGEALARRLDELETELAALRVGAPTAAAQPRPEPKPEVKPEPKFEIKPEPKPEPTQAEPAAVEEPASPASQEAPADDEPPFPDEPPQLGAETPLFGEEPTPAREPSVFEEKPAAAEPDPKPIAPAEAPAPTPAASTASGLAPFPQWTAAVDALKKDPVLYQILQTSTAYRRDAAVFIDSKSPAFPMLLQQPQYAQAVTSALRKVTGEDLRPMVFSPESEAEVEEEAYTLESFVKKLDEAGVEYTIKE